MPELNTKMLLRWHELGSREQMVWAAVFAQADEEPVSAAHAADETVLSLRALAIDGEARAPEYDLAKLGLNIDREAFDPWYRIAYQITYPRDYSGVGLTESACAAAYERYRLSRADFY
jgi:hypothetical protein